MNYELILRHYWGYNSFRGIQREIIESVGAGKDTLGLMPTGGGKSLTFQVPAMAMPGLCLVVTPLIALMKDQVDNLRRKNITAYAIYSGMTRNEIVTTLENCIFGEAKFLYVSPERLGTEIFQNKIRKMRVNLIAVDEAHCISQWGYDFRPAYLEIAKIRKLVPNAPVLALTATATQEVVDDIQRQLAPPNPSPRTSHSAQLASHPSPLTPHASQLASHPSPLTPHPQFNVFRMSFARENLAYRVHHVHDKQQELIDLLRRTEGSAIVYTRSRQRTKEIAELINSQKPIATYYHAGLEPTTKEERQEAWQNDKVRVMVATNAFGMGIDKPDVRLVIHIDCPSSLEAYFQEAGRAGRDGKPSWAIMLYNDNDNARLRKRIDDTFPPREAPEGMQKGDEGYPQDNIRDIYNHLAYFYQIGVGSGNGYTFEFDIDRFCTNFHHFPTRVNAALAILQRAGYIEYEQEPDTRARLMFLLKRHELYNLQTDNATDNAVITALLRCYGGLFTDYGYIEESFVAKEAGIDRQSVYDSLKRLSHRHIIDFIPRKSVPLITYTRDRIDGESLVITTEAYDKRKEEFTRRIQSVIDYASNDEICRSRQLLRYFGETKSKDCAHCDVCHNHSKTLTPKNGLAMAINKIETLLSDGKPHPISDLHGIGRLSDNDDYNIASDTIDKALRYLLDEEKAFMDGSFISLSR